MIHSQKPLKRKIKIKKLKAKPRKKKRIRIQSAKVRPTMSYYKKYETTGIDPFMKSRMKKKLYFDHRS